MASAPMMEATVPPTMIMMEAVEEGQGVLEAELDGPQAVVRRGVVVAVDGGIVDGVWELRNGIGLNVSAAEEVVVAWVR